MLYVFSCVILQRLGNSPSDARELPRKNIKQIDNTWHHTLIVRVSAKKCINLVGFPNPPGSVEIVQFIHSKVSDILTTERHTARKKVERNNRYGIFKIMAEMY
jgi:hypothetical protein